MKKCSIVLALLFTVVSFSQTKNRYNVGFLFDKQTTEVTQLLFSLQDEIKAVVGEDAIIEYAAENVLVNQYNLEKASLNYQTLLNNDTDIIIAFGLVNNQLISNLSDHKKPTILFGAVNNDFDHFTDNNATSGVFNFTYLIAPQSFKKDLQALKQLTSFTKISIAVQQNLLELFPYKEVFDLEAKTLGFSYNIIPYQDANDIINGITTDIDAFYLATGFFLTPDDITKISASLIEKKIPSFTTTNTKDVAHGLMATNQSSSNISQFFRRIALSVEAYVNGQKLSELPVFIQSSNELTINFNTLERVGLVLKYSLISKTNFVGDFENVLSEKKYNLLDVMSGVVGENLALLSRKKEIALSAQSVKTSRSNYLPSVVAGTMGTYIDPNLAVLTNGQNAEFSTSGAIAVQQTLYSEATNANISIQKDLLESQKQTYNATELDVIFSAANAYFNALILKANVQIQNQNLNLTKKNLQIANQNFEAGQSGKSDVLRFTSERAQNTQTFIESINQLQQAYISLNQLLNNPIDLEIDVDDAELGQGILKNYNYNLLKDIIDDVSLRNLFIEYLVKVAIENAPEIKSLDYNLKATKRTINLNGFGRFIPTLSLNGQYNKNFNQWGAGSEQSLILDNNYNVGVQVSIPIFNRMQTNINKQTAEIQQQQLTINKQNIALGIAANINSAVLNLTNQIANIEISKISEKTAKQSLELTQVSYANGAVNIVQLLDAQNNYLSAQLSQITAVYNYLLSSIELERYMSYYFLLHTQEENQDFIQKFYDYIQDRN